MPSTIQLQNMIREKNKEIKVLNQLYEDAKRNRNKAFARLEELEIEFAKRINGTSVHRY